MGSDQLKGLTWVASARKWLGHQKKLIANIEEGSLIIKKPHSLLDFSTEPDENFMIMAEINKEIHKAREENDSSRQVNRLIAD